MAKDYRYRMGQDLLRDTFENAQARMEYHPDIAKKHRQSIEQYEHFKTEKDALKNALAKLKDGHSDFQIWAKIEKEGEFYRIADWWIVTADWKIKQAADYIGMALMYDETRLLYITQDNANIDDVVAYW